MPPGIKFCGLTRAEDARMAARLGADYVGVVLAESLRRVAPDHGALVLDAAGSEHGAPKRVGVFGNDGAEEIARSAAILRLDAVQLHAARIPDEVRAVRAGFDGELWAVVRVTEAAGEEYDALAGIADGVVLDAYSERALGGTGGSFDWLRVAASLQSRPRPRRLIVAGGLRPENVAVAIAALRPNIVDVSSGIESAPGVKDHERMKAFARAVAECNP